MSGPGTRRPTTSRAGRRTTPARATLAADSSPLDVPTPGGARVVDDSDELAALFAARPDVHLYALTDLEEPFWSASRWFRRADATVGLVGMPDGVWAVYGLSTADPSGSLDLVAEVAPALPAGVQVIAPTGLADRLRPVRDVRWVGPHERWVLAEPDLLPADGSPADAATGDLVPLGVDDLAEMSALYANEPGAAFFLPHMLGHATFVGVRDEGELVAVAGTHVLSVGFGVAAVGAVYTRPSHRGRGLARRTTAGAIRRARSRRSDLVIGLNVAADNTSARRVYESLGFRPVLDFDEAELA